MLIVNVIAAPELHDKGPAHQELGEAAPNEGRVLEQPTPSLLIEVPIFEHRRVRIEVANAGRAATHRVNEARRSLPKPTNSLSSGLTQSCACTLHLGNRHVIN